jgi:hypothetical protein
MPTIRIPANDWKPRYDQMNLWSYLEGGGKRAAQVAHRRWGKDEIALRWASVAALERPATYWHMLPEYGQARKVIWDAVNPHSGRKRIEETFPPEICKRVRNQEMIIDFPNNSTWQLVGSDNYDSLVGSPPAGVVFSEWAVAKPDAWAYLRPILAENKGWALFIYTPRGRNHGKTTYDFALIDPAWHCELLTVDDTPVFDEDTIEAERREMIAQFGPSRGEALFQQEYYCSWVEAFEGKTVYPEFNQAFHVSKIPLLPLAAEGVRHGRQIFRGWDNTGLNPACIITYVNSIGQWFWLKEFCGFDIGIEDFAEMVHVWCAQNFPADTSYRDIGDPAGKIRDTLKGSPAEYIRRATGIKIQDGIQTFKIRREAAAGRLNKTIKGKASILIDPTECPMVIAGFLGGYCYPEIGDTGYFRPEPQKNEYSHIHDAGQYLASILFPTGYGKEETDSVLFNNIASRERDRRSDYQEVYTH